MTYLQQRNRTSESSNPLVEVLTDRSVYIQAMSVLAVSLAFYYGVLTVSRFEQKAMADNNIYNEAAVAANSIEVEAKGGAFDNIKKALGERSLEDVRPIEKPIEKHIDEPKEETATSRLAKALIGTKESKKIVIVNPNTEPVSPPVEEKAEPETPKEIFAQKAEEALSKKNTEEFLWHSIRAEDYTPVATAAIMGNYMQESGLNPADRPPIFRNGATFGGLGFGQWMGGRRLKLIEKYPDTYETAESQVDYTFHELDTNYREVKNDILNTDDVSEAVEIFQTRYEKCDPAHCNFAARDRLAKKYLEKYGNITE